MPKNRFKIGTGRWLFLLIILFIIISILFFLSYREVKRNTINEFNKQQMILAEQAAAGITEFFSNLTNEFEFLVNINDVTALNENGKKILVDYLKKKKPVLSSISRIDSSGKLTWLTPYNKKLIGTDISYQKHIKYLLENQIPTLSDVFVAVQGYRAIAFHYPILKNGKFHGSIALLINFEYISKRYLENIAIGDAGYAWVLSRDGVMIYDPVPGLSGVSIYETLSSYPEVIKISELMMKGEKGTSTYNYDRLKKEQIGMTIKHAAYTPVSIMNTHWSIAVATPEYYIISNVQGFKNKSIIIMLLFLAIGVVFMYFANRNIVLSNEILTSKKNEAFLKAQEENLRITLNSIGDAVIATDKTGVITRMNPAAKKITGWNFSESEGRPISEIFNAADRVKGINCDNPINHILQKNERIDLLNDINLTQKNGSVAEVSGSFAPIFDSSENIVGSILVFRDITEKNRITEQLHQAQKMDIVGQLAGGVAHDFNNMLSGIMGSAELLRYEAGENPKLKKYIDIILESAKRSANLTSQLLAFSRKGKTVSTPVDIHELIIAAIDLLERSIDKKITITTRLSAINSCTAGDPALLQNAILNLAINARDAMPEGGTITISTSDVILDYDTIRHNSLNAEPGPYIEIDVSDTGNGIPEDIIQKIFDPFFTTKPAGKGTGLGLSGVYGTVKDHKGIVTVYSEPGEGTIFKIYLRQSDQIPLIADDTKNLIARGSGCILVIDDESIIRNTAHGILTAAGYEVILAEDGITGSEIYEAEMNKISLVVLDMIMPKLSGIETFRKLKSINPEVKIIFASGFNNEGSVQDILKSGAKGFIQKPYMLSEFTKLVDEVIRS
ncbi:MAG: hypothetical protein CVV49_02425 [Spirochaetae bacterium HGW-Spirochaetae-5]|nr:MAG: hypothetical protein CVV49_02425 [Spirochaetae bacterium HGW-Spirochaetae-5]